MTFIILDSLPKAKTLNKKINDHMIRTIPGYNAIQWCKILTDNEGNYSVYIKSFDSRNPEKVLDNLTKEKIIDTLPDSFYHNKEDEEITLKIPNYVE